MPISSSTRLAKRASVRAGLPWCRRSVPDRSRKASSIETGSTSGVSSSMSRPDLAARDAVLLHVRLDHHRVGAGFERLEHRHGGAHAVGARHIAGGRHDAAPAAADDDRLVGEARDRPASRPRRRRRRSPRGRSPDKSRSGWPSRRGEPQAMQRFSPRLFRRRQAVAAEGDGPFRAPIVTRTPTATASAGPP